MRITKDIKLVTSGGIFDLFDNLVKSALNITDKEYDYLCESMTDEECIAIVGAAHTFSEKRKILQIRNKYLEQMNSKTY